MLGSGKSRSMQKGYEGLSLDQCLGILQTRAILGAVRFSFGGHLGAGAHLEVAQAGSGARI